MGTAKSVASSRAVQAKAGKREKPERKQRLFGLGNGEECSIEQSRAGEGRQERKAGGESRGFSVLGTAKSVASSRAVQAKAGKREKPERKQRLFCLGNGEECSIEQSRAGEGRQERKAGAKAEAFRSWERRKMYRRAEPWRANAGSNGEESRAVQAKDGSNGEESRAVQAKAGKREKPERKQRLFGLGNGEECSIEQSRAGEGLHHTQFP